ncbi:GNAT family N-acetyltransferase [Mangrovactinospora gilvigrisea]|nr:GNAT family N-acetyltransferase [Mangrovactinospora gilvigrisea]
MREQLTTRRLELRCFRPRDAEELHAIFSDPLTRTFTGGAFTEPAQTRRWIERRMQAFADTGLAWYGLRLQGTGQLVGNCGLFPGPSGPTVTEIGYEIHQPHQGRGLAAEAAAAVLAEATACAVGEVWATVRPDNAASLRLTARLGFTHRHTRQEGGRPLLYLACPAEATADSAGDETAGRWTAADG